MWTYSFVSRHRIEVLLIISLCVLLLLLPAFYNGFPYFFNNDSAVYIESGCKFEAKPDRSIIYGIFVRYVSGFSIWMVVVIQAYLLAILLFLCFKHFSTTPNFRPRYFFCVLFITLMGAGFDVSWVMPDIFTSISILSLALLLFAKPLGKMKFIGISLIFCLSLIIHSSHIYIVILILLSIAAVLLFMLIWRKTFFLKDMLKIKMPYITGLVILCAFSTAFIHSKCKNGKFSSSLGASVFLMNNMIEMGIIDSYLSEYCWENNYRLCEYAGRMPNNFLWDPGSPLQKTGGWSKANQDEYLLIEKRILTHPKYLSLFLFKSALFTIKQFFNFDLDHAQKPTDYVRNTVAKYYPKENNRYRSSRQFLGRLNFFWLNYSQRLLFFLCAAFFICHIYNRQNRQLTYSLLFVFLSILANDIICSVFSGVYPRYQTRVIFLMPIPLFLYFSSDALVSFFNIFKAGKGRVKVVGRNGFYRPGL